MEEKDISTNEGKICATCKEFKYLYEYDKNKERLMGVRAYCKKCTRPKQRLHYQNNKEKYKESFQEFMIRNPDYYKKYLIK